MGSTPESPHHERLLWDKKAVAAAVAVSLRTLSRWVAAGEFPPADVRKGATIRRWKPETVINWIESNAEGE